MFSKMKSLFKNKLNGSNYDVIAKKKIELLNQVESMN